MANILIQFKEPKICKKTSKSSIIKWGWNMKFNRNNIEIGHYMSKTNIQLSDNNLKINFGDEFDITDVLKNNRVEILHDHKSYIFDKNILDGAIIALSH